MSFVQQLILCMLFLLGMFYVKLRWKRRRLEYFAGLLAGPPTLPFIGSVYKLIGLKSTIEVLKVSMADLKKHGKVVKYWNGYELVILVSDPYVVEELMTGPDAVEKPPAYRFFANNIGGVFMAGREKWHQMRKFLNLTFNPKLMEGYISTFNKQAKLLLKILGNHENQEIDPKPLVARCLIDNIIESHFGIESNEQLLNKRNLAKLMARSIEVSLLRGTKLWLYPDFIFKRTDLYKESRRVKEIPSRHFTEVMEKCLKRFINSANISENKLQYYTDMLTKWVIQKGIHPTPKLLKYMTSDIIIAGYDTISTNICQLLYFLAIHPKIQENVLAEIDEIFKEKDVNDIEKNDFAKMKYLNMVINESLRLCSPPFIMRKLNRDLRTDYGILPAESSVCVSIYSLHRDPKYWQYPDEFFPEHFLPENVAARPKLAFLPFSYGPRNCPGKLYSTWASIVIISTILRKYRIETKTSKSIDYKIVLMIEPVNGFSLKFVPRG